MKGWLEQEDLSLVRAQGELEVRPALGLSVCWGRGTILNLFVCLPSHIYLSGRESHQAHRNAYSDRTKDKEGPQGPKKAGG